MCGALRKIHENASWVSHPCQPMEGGYPGCPVMMREFLENMFQISTSSLDVEHYSQIISCTLGLIRMLQSLEWCNIFLYLSNIQCAISNQCFFNATPSMLIFLINIWCHLSQVQVGLSPAKETHMLKDAFQTEMTPLKCILVLNLSTKLLSVEGTFINSQWYFNAGARKSSLC